jgi:hypothetical protein
MSDPGEMAGAALVGAARDLATQAVSQAAGELDALVGQVQSAVEGAQDAAERAVELPEDIMRRVTELADQQDPLGTVLWLMVRLANALAPAGVTLAAYDPSPGTGRPRSLAVTYTSGVVTVALAFATATPSGGGLILSAHGNAGGPVKIQAPPVSVRIEGLTDDSVAIPFAAGVTVDSHSTVTATVALDAPAAGDRDLGVRLGRPTLTVALSPSTDAFHYRAELSLRGNGVTIGLAPMLGALAQFVSLPRIDESLDLALTLEDGRMRVGRLAGVQP